MDARALNSECAKDIQADYGIDYVIYIYIHIYIYICGILPRNCQRKLMCSYNSERLCATNPLVNSKLYATAPCNSPMLSQGHMLSALQHPTCQCLAHWAIAAQCSRAYNPWLNHTFIRRKVSVSSRSQIQPPCSFFYQ